MLKYASVAMLLLAAGCARHDDQTNTTAGNGSPAAGMPTAAASPVKGSGVRALAARHAFASLPDRGDLVGYPANPMVRADGAYTWHRADFSEAHAVNALGGVLRITTPSGELVDFRYDRHIEHSSGDWTWIGHVANGSQLDDAVITFGAKAAFGTIAQPGKAPLRLTIRDGVSWLVETDPAKVALISSGAARPSSPDFLVPPETLTAAASGRRPLSAAAQAIGAATPSSPVIDLVLGYTSGFAAGLGGQSQAITRLNNMVQMTNEAYVNSQIPGRVRLVGTVQVSYPDNTSNSDTLEKLTGYRSGIGRTAPDPAFSALRAARDQYGADLVSLVRKFSDPENDGCGIAWLIGGGGSGNGSIAAGDEYFGYSVVSDGRDVGTDGKTYYCREETLAHELGHNMGSQHDRATATKDGRVSYGVYPYSFGYKTAASGANFYTVMAYGDSGQTSYRLFSNPRTTLCGGLPCGVDGQADNARSMAQTMIPVAAFRTSSTQPRSRVRLDLNGDGRADIIWHNPDGVVQPWFMNGSSWDYGDARPVASQYGIAGIGDFNGDGLADIVWADRAQTQLWAWIAQAGGSQYSIVFLREYPVGWNIVGTGDVNADGRSDIIWHHPSGAFQPWLMDGTTWAYGEARSVPNQYAVAGVGDFNGDGLADILWEDTAKTQLWVWMAYRNASGLNYDIRYLRGYPMGWEAAAVADADADGKDEVFWSTTGSMQTMGIDPYVKGLTYGEREWLPDNYRIDAVADFNGDGRADVVWKNTAGTELWMWTARSGARIYYEVAYLRNFPVGWKIASSY